MEADLGGPTCLALCWPTCDVRWGRRVDRAWGADYLALSLWVGRRASPGAGLPLPNAGDDEQTALGGPTCLALSLLVGRRAPPCVGLSIPNMGSLAPGLGLQFLELVLAGVDDDVT